MLVGRVKSKYVSASGDGFSGFSSSSSSSCKTKNRKNYKSSTKNNALSHTSKKMFHATTITHNEILVPGKSVAPVFVINDFSKVQVLIMFLIYCIYSSNNFFLKEFVYRIKHILLNK